MGLFDKLKKTVLKTEDEVLLTEAMIAVSFADGDDQWEESQLIKAFLLALDVALSSGDIDDGEEEVLAAMQVALGISDDQAQRYADVLQVKYSS